MRRLLQNLISNAIKYTPSGRVLVGARRRGGHLVLEVWDTGLGIPPSKQRIVFREFQRLDQGVKVARGLGLGLSIVERIGRVLKHPITLNSEVGTRLRVPGRGAGGGGPSGHAPQRPSRRRRPRPCCRACACSSSTTSPPSSRACACCSRAGAARPGPRPISRRRIRPCGRTRRLPEVIIADYHLDETRRPRAHQGPALEDAGRHAGRARHRRPHAGRARRGGRDEHPRAQQAAEAGGPAGAADAMARDESGGGVGSTSSPPSR